MRSFGRMKRMRVLDLTGRDLVGGRQQRRDGKAGRVGRGALVAALVVGIGLRQIPDEGAERGKGGAGLRRVVQLVQLLLRRLDGEHVAVVLARVAAVVGAAFGVPARDERHLQRHGVAVGASVAVAAARRGDGLARSRAVGEEERDREVDLQLVAVAPAARGDERRDDGVGARVLGQRGDVRGPWLGLLEEAADRRDRHATAAATAAAAAAAAASATTSAAAAAPAAVRARSAANDQEQQATRDRRQDAHPSCYRYSARNATLGLMRVARDAGTDADHRERQRGRRAGSAAYRDR